MLITPIPGALRRLCAGLRNLSPQRILYWCWGICWSSAKLRSRSIGETMRLALELLPGATFIFVGDEYKKGRGRAWDFGQGLLLHKFGRGKETSKTIFKNRKNCVTERFQRNKVGEWYGRMKTINDYVTHLNETVLRKSNYRQ